MGISCYTGNFIEASSLAKTIKEIDGKSLMVIGGYHATSEYEYIIGNHNEFDIAIRGRGEIPFTELICALSNNQDLNEVHSIAYRRNGNVIVTASTKTVTGNYLPDRKNENKYFISSGKDLDKSDWLSFVGAYLSFIGTAGVSLIALFQSSYYNRSENERREKEHRKCIQPIFSVNIRGIDTQIGGTAEVLILAIRLHIQNIKILNCQ